MAIEFSFAIIVAFLKPTTTNLSIFSVVIVFVFNTDATHFRLLLCSFEIQLTQKREREGQRNLMCAFIPNTQSHTHTPPIFYIASDVFVFLVGCELNQMSGDKIRVTRYTRNFTFNDTISLWVTLAVRLIYTKNVPLF